MKQKTCKRYNIPNQVHELTFSCHKQQPFLKNKLICMFIIEAIIKAKEKHNFHIWAYVIMPEHIHLLIYPLEEDYSISEILRSIKQPVSQRVIGYFKKNCPDKLKLFGSGREDEPYHFWMPGGGYDRNVTSKKVLAYTVDYIHNNPVRRGLVGNPEDWEWSSAREWKIPGTGPITIDRESFPVL